MMSDERPLTAFQKYAVLKNAKMFRVLENKENLPWSAYVGILGMPGQTAYYAWKEFARPEKVFLVW